jgi:c-di-GMP-binding flagellar brake protein YcgR
MQPDSEPEVETFNGMVNLSGGGVYFTASRPLAMHAELLLNLVFGEPFGEIRGVVGEVVRTHESRRGEHWVGVKFVKIAPKDRDLIISFCLAEQRKILRMRVMTLAVPEAG